MQRSVLEAGPSVHFRKLKPPNVGRYVHTVTPLPSAANLPALSGLSVRLDDIREHLVHLADLRGDAVVDGAVADFDDKAAEDIGSDLFVGAKRGVRFGLSSADALWRHDCAVPFTRTFVTTFIFLPWLYWDFETADSSRLISLSSSFFDSKDVSMWKSSPGSLQKQRWNALSYGSTRNNQLNLSSMRTHEFLEVVTDILQYAQSVVLGQRLQEVLHGAALVRAPCMFFQLGYDLGFVARGQGGCAEDGGQLVIGLEDLVERDEGFGDGVEGACLCGGGELEV